MLDAHLPGMTGFEVLGQLRAMPGSATAPACMGARPTRCRRTCSAPTRPASSATGPNPSTSAAVLADIDAIGRQLRGAAAPAAARRRPGWSRRADNQRSTPSRRRSRRSMSFAPEPARPADAADTTADAAVQPRNARRPHPLGGARFSRRVPGRPRVDRSRGPLWWLILHGIESSACARASRRPATPASGPRRARRSPPGPTCWPSCLAGYLGERGHPT